MTGDRFYTTSEVVDMLRVHEQTVRRWIRSGELPAVMLGRKAGYRVRASDLGAFLDERTERKDAARREPGSSQRPHSG